VAIAIGTGRAIETMGETMEAATMAGVATGT